MNAAPGQGGTSRARTGRFGSEQGTILTGGTTNRGLVSRVGDTVRRPRRPNSASTRALLDHLHEVGFDGAPRYLGIDERGREVLSYVEGDAVTSSSAQWALTDDALVSVALLLRRYHQAVASFDADRWWWAHPLPPPWRGRLVSHNDPNLDNVVFRGGTAVALIDFDLAAPGSALWDVACAARLWAPVRDEGDIDDVRQGRSLDRLRLFVDAYELPAAERARLVDAMIDAHRWCYDVVREAVRIDHPSFAPYWRGGAADRADRAQLWFQTHRGEIESTVSTRAGSAGPVPAQP